MKTSQLLRPTKRAICKRFKIAGEWQESNQLGPIPNAQQTGNVRVRLIDDCYFKSTLHFKLNGQTSDDYLF